MSGIERKIGKLIPVLGSVDKLERFAKWAESILKHPDDLEYTITSFKEANNLLNRRCYNKPFSIYVWESEEEYIYYNKVIYKIEVTDEPDYDDYFCKITKNYKNEIEFDTIYYNGGTYLSEVLADNIDSINDLE